MEKQSTQSIQEFLMEWIARGIFKKSRCISDIAIILYKNKRYDNQKDSNDFTERDKLEIRLLPRIKPIKREGKFYKIHIQLLLEKLTSEKVACLKNELNILKDLHDLDFEEGLGLMIQIFIMFSDYYRIANNMIPIYPRNEIDKIELLSYNLLKRDSEKVIELYSNKKMLILNEILEFWNKSELSSSQNIFDVMLPYMKNTGRISYLTMPPAWRHFMTMEQSEKKKTGLAAGMALPGDKLYIRNLTKLPKYLNALEILKEQIRKHKKEEIGEEEFVDYIENEKENKDENEKKLKEYIIQKEKLSWKIIYDGNEYTLPKNRKAIEIIKLIIENDKGDGIHIFDICKKFIKNKKQDEKRYDYSNSDYKDAQWEEEEGMSIIDPKSKVIKTTKEEALRLKKRLYQLIEKRHKAQIKGDYKTIDDIDKETKDIQQKLFGEKDKDGNILEWSPQQKNCYDSVKRCYDRFINEIYNAEYEKLHIHFKSFIIIGTYCFYKPDRHIPWNI